jgi:hypothetical protein
MTSNDIDTDPVSASSLIGGWSTEQSTIALRNERLTLDSARMCIEKRDQGQS